ncbi:MAG TPA: hypothetical protein VIK55_06430 [Paludibacter sp.]
MEIHKRNYDNEFNKDGSKKFNEFLGEFDIIETLFEDSYSSQRIGVAGDKVYLIDEIEVSGYSSGSRFEVKELSSVKRI